ncbi:hypothetical protein [Embleya sp. NPDC059237]|uniref:hypothetical protein n=1 Tax=Embleya sp. NPDC059237 TaxID=3346784 RepID=UPI003686EE42
MTDVHKMYADTIATPVDLAAHTDLLGPRLAGQLRCLFPSGRAALWGVSRGRNDANVKKAVRIEPGNQAFFSGDRKLYLSGQVAATFRNPQLARRLWGADTDDNTWEFMYALNGVRQHHLPMDELRELLGWKPARNVQNLTHLSEVESALLTELLQLDPPIRLDPEPVPDRTPPDTDADTHSEPDLASAGTRVADMREDVPARTSTCALCQLQLPAGVLRVHAVKSHLACSQEERESPDNVMPLCALGCGELFTQGYLAVAPGGDIQVSPYTTKNPILADYVRRNLTAPRTPWWTPEREPFYAWHRERVFRLPPTA